MNNRSIIVHYGGSWYKETYSGGERRFVLVPSSGFTYASLLGRIQVMVGANTHQHIYSIESLIPQPEGDYVRMNIFNDLDLKFVMDNISHPKIYVTISPMPNEGTSCMLSQPAMKQNFVTLFSGQSVQDFQRIASHDQKNHMRINIGTLPQPSSFQSQTSNVNLTDQSINIDCGDKERCDDFTDEHDVDDVVDQFVGEETLQIENRHVNQWIIPGALYQASFPFDDSRECEQYKRDELSCGATFKEKESLQIAVGIYNLLNRTEYSVTKSCNNRYSVVCKYKDKCAFEMRATYYESHWRVIKWVQPHECKEDFRLHGPRTLSSKVIGAFFAPRLLHEGAVLRPKEMTSLLENQYGFKVDYSVALAGRNHAIDMVYGETRQSFRMLPSYLYMVQQANPGSIVELQTKGDDNCFEYAFMALSASIHGFLSSARPVIIVDGTHLKGKYKGVMFIAATKDGNEKIFPLAVGLGDKENDASWNWFFKQLRRTFGCPHDLLIVSDQHVSIKKAIEVVFPGIPHGVCIYHLQKNLAKFGKHVISVFQKAANCYKVEEFEKHMNSLVDSKKRAYQKLMEIGPCRWARSKCVVRRYGFLTSNSPSPLMDDFDGQGDCLFALY